MLRSAGSEPPNGKANGAAKGSPARPKEEVAKPAAADLKPQKENKEAASQDELMKDYPGLQDYEKPVSLSADPFFLRKAVRRQALQVVTFAGGEAMVAQQVNSCVNRDPVTAILFTWPQWNTCP